MRKVREVLRLYHAAGMSIRAIARSVGVSPTKAGDYVRRAELQGLTWPLPESLDDAALQRRLLMSPAPPKGTPPPECLTLIDEFEHFPLSGSFRLAHAISPLWRVSSESCGAAQPWLRASHKGRQALFARS